MAVSGKRRRSAGGTAPAHGWGGPNLPQSAGQQAYRRRPDLHAGRFIRSQMSTLQRSCENHSMAGSAATEADSRLDNMGEHNIASRVALENRLLIWGLPTGALL